MPKKSATIVTWGGVIGVLYIHLTIFRAGFFPQIALTSKKSLDGLNFSAACSIENISFFNLRSKKMALLVKRAAAPIKKLKEKKLL